MSDESVDNPFPEPTLSFDRCFLCGASLDQCRTDEHVFPQWLQRRFNLWNKQLVLPNGTFIRYRQLTIPCCYTCNHDHMSPIEMRIERAAAEGFSAFRELDELLVYQWIQKIQYGLWFKDLSLLIDRKKPHKGPIMPPEELVKFCDRHLFLQSTRLQFQFVGYPFSLFVVQMHYYEDQRAFDYHDTGKIGTFSIRMGDIGILAVLDDNGTQQEATSEYFRQFDGIRLHPVQFDELFAKVTYSAVRMNRTPKYIIAEASKEPQSFLVMCPGVQGYSRAPVFDPWEAKPYSKVLFRYWKEWGISYEDVYLNDSGVVLTFVHNEDGTVNRLAPDFLYDQISE